MKTCSESKADSKFLRNQETETVGKTTPSRQKPPPEKSTNFNEIQRNFHNSETDSNEENQLPVKDTNIENNNNNEDNCLRINDSDIENCNNESTVKFNQGKLAFILGDNVVKDVDGYLLTRSNNSKFIVERRHFSFAKSIDIGDYTKPTKRDFNTDLYILHVGTNYLSLDETQEVISTRIIDTAKPLMTEKTKVIFFKHCAEGR